MFREKERTKKERERRQPRIKKEGNRVRRSIVKMDGGNNKVKTCVYEDRSLGRRKTKLQKEKEKTWSGIGLHTVYGAGWCVTKNSS
jgi:hypothetical protein